MEDYKEKRKALWSNAATGGLILGVILVLISVVDYTLGFYGKNIWLSLSQYLAIVAGIVFFTIQYREKVGGGFISYKESLAFGVLVSVFATIISGAFLYILVTVIDPNYLDHQMRVVMDEMIQKGQITESQIDMVEKSMRMMSNPIVILLISILSGAFMGLIFSLITSIFTKKERPMQF